MLAAAPFATVSPGWELPLKVLLFASVCLGQAGLFIFTLNCLHGCALPRRVLREIRHLLFLLILTTPLLVWWVHGFDVQAESAWWPLAALCGVLGLAVLPAITLQRLLRRRPATLQSYTATTVDIAQDLGYRPLGQSKYRPLAQLPFNQVFQVDFTEQTLRLPRLPAAWDGLTILHLTDLHLCGTPDRSFHERVIERCRDWGTPDVVAITGDVVDSAWHHRWIVPVLGRLRWRHAAYAILGNHDSYRNPPQVRRRLERLGMQVLGNTWEQMTVRGEPLVVVGHEGPWFRPAPDPSGCPEGAFRLCLSHTPDNIDWALRHDIDLMLAGHNHGGQIRFPLIGSVLVPSRYSRRYDCGLFQVGPTVLHVGRGLAGQHPLRYFCRPEVTWLVLRPAERAG